MHHDLIGTTIDLNVAGYARRVKSLTDKPVVIVNGHLHTERAYITDGNFVFVNVGSIGRTSLAEKSAIPQMAVVQFTKTKGKAMTATVEFYKLIGYGPDSFLDVPAPDPDDADQAIDRFIAELTADDDRVYDPVEDTMKVARTEGEKVADRVRTLLSENA